MSADIQLEGVGGRSVQILRPWDTILEEPQQRVVDTNHLRLPPPTSAQHDRQERGPPKVVKSHDQRLLRDFHTQDISMTFSSAHQHRSHLKHQFTPIPMDVVTIRCSTPNCSCDCFTPGKTQMRICANCNHGWISHAIDNVRVSHRQSHIHHNSHPVNSHPSMDSLQTSQALDIASLILYGTHALPIRLKILLDRVLHTLERDDLLHLLHGFGWTFDDYTRGYMLQDSSGNSFSRWAIVSKEEELLVLKLFLKFSETKSIAQNFVLEDHPTHPTPSDSYSPNNSLFVNKRDTNLKKYSEKLHKSSISSLIKNSLNNKLNNNNTHNMNSGLTENNRSVNRQEINQKTIGSRGECLESISPNDKKPYNNESPLSSVQSPLNKLQNMQPFDYRKSESSSKLASIASDIPIGYPIDTTTPLSSTTSSFSFMSSGLPLMSTTFATNNVSSISTNMTSTTNSDMSGTDGLTDDESNISGAINLSQTSSAFALKKVKHLRKSANPMKRRWNPMVLSGLATNPSTGKKRVQCHVCMKTFCDKGALKIHFSAVHLREMHKCTVDGCNMMFSSRRSRNRHSANPNPKLHTPNLRRKINPHDGRSANPYPLIPPTSSSSLLNLTSNSLIGQNIDSNQILESDQINKEMENNFLNKSVLNLDCDRDSLSPNSSCPSPDSEMTPLSSFNHKNDLTEKTNKQFEIKTKNGSPEDGMDLSIKEDFPTNKRKRKNLNPIRFAPINITASDDDLKYNSSDDSSSDTYIDRIDDNLIDDSKSDFDSSDDIMFAEHLRQEKEKKMLAKVEKHKPILPVEEEDQDEIKYDIDGTIDLSKKTRPSPPPAIEDKKQKIKTESSFANKMKPTISGTEPVMENPLRHLESLSMGSFSNLVNPRNQKNSMFLSNSMHSLSFHAPGLGLSLKPPTPPTNQTISKQTEKPTNASTKESDHYTERSLSAANVNNIPSGMDMDSCIGDHVSLMAPFRDASYIGQIEVPVDKENPRRCTACGKIFQNHFGVKTHYQNVHLKLMHKCTVDGCNASFPSKRSRDRHSANLNLHRKLLSTHSDGKSPFNLEKTGSTPMFPFPSAALRDDFLRLYDPQGLPLNLNEIYSRLPPLGPDGLFAASAAAAAAASFPVMPGFHPSMCLPPLPHTSNSLFMDGRSSVSRESANSIRTSPSPPPSKLSSPTQTNKSHRISSPANVVLEATLLPNENGKYVCIYCQTSKSDSDSLKDHYQRIHSDILHRCCLHNCNKAFLDKKSRKKHIQFHSPAISAETPL